MPSAYTAPIKDGITFEQFAMNCARAFGALIEMRDMPDGAEIPERFEPSDYHIKALERERAALAELEALSPEQCETRAIAEFEKDEDYRLRALREARALQQKYESMLAMVRDWQPPSDDHQGMKDFMVQQIQDSIKFDCGVEYYETPTERKTGAEWLADSLARVRGSIARHEEGHAAEVARTEGRNEWLRLLRESLTK